MRYAKLKLFRLITVGESCVLCCSYNKDYMKRAKELRWQEAFFTFRRWVQVLILFGIFKLELVE